MGYHIDQIDKGQVGEFSKIKEEFQELQDAVKQDIDILILCELSDLYGSMECYLGKYFCDISMEDIKQFSNLTKKAFKDGTR